MNVLLTGANGFLGSRLTQCLDEHSSFHLTSVVRKGLLFRGAHTVEINALDDTTDWSSALLNQEVIIHTAARAHIMKDELSDPLAEYRSVNVVGTLNLARQAAKAGVKRFIFISSIKVNGESTKDGVPFTADDQPAPEDAYGVSKMEAEIELKSVAAETGMELVIIRPPLVYGPGVKGNFASLVKLVRKELPLPLGAVHNKRSLISLDNLVDLIITCVDHPSAANQTFLASDGEDQSTTELLRGVAKAMGCRPRLIPVPAGVLVFGASVMGKKDVAKRILGSLQVDISKTRDLLQWQPLLTVEEGLAKAVGN